MLIKPFAVRLSSGQESTTVTRIAVSGCSSTGAIGPTLATLTKSSTQSTSLEASAYDELADHRLLRSQRLDRKRSRSPKAVMAE